MSTKTQSLANRRIAITRASDQSGALRERLVALGAETIELPLIKVTSQIDKNDLADCMLELGSYDWIIFTSANGVRCFFDQFFKLFDDIRSLGLIRVACIGEATAEALAPLHLKIECMPKKATAEALASALEATGSLDSAKVLLVTGNLNRETLEKKLEEARAIVDRLPVYKTERNDISADNSSAQYRKLGADAMLFASSSAVESFLAQHDALSLSPAARVPLFGSIGPQTSESMRKGGIKIDFEAESPSLDDLVDALVKALGKA